MKSLTLLGITAIATSVCGFAQPGLTARELFYSPVASAKPAPEPVKEAKQTPPVKPSPAKPKPPRTETAKTAETKPDPERTPERNPEVEHAVQASVPLGLRYAVLKRNGAGRFQEVDPDAPFRAGDRIRLQVDANTTGYLYIVMQGSSGNWQLLFPSPEVYGGNNQVQKGQSLQIPPGDRGQFVFDEQAGTEKLFIVLTRQPEQDLDKLIYAVRRQPEPETPGRVMVAQATVRDDVVNRLRQEVRSRDLVFEKVDAADAPPQAEGGRVETAAYVVNPSTSADARLVVDVALRHQ